MDLVVEDGTGLANANSYCSEEDADAYHATRMFSEPWVTDADEKRTVLAWATRLLDETTTWKGLPATTTQVLGWPRAGTYDRNGVAIASTAVPAMVRNATAELARLLLQGDRAASADERVVTAKSTSNGSTSITFGGASETMRTVPMAVAAMLAPVTASPRVVRG